MIKQNWNKAWLFNKYGESKYRRVDLPHDAMLEEKRVPDLENGSASGFYPGGKYIYQKTLRADEALITKTVLLEFEGVYMDSDVYLNDERVGGHYYGYTNFFVDLTGKLKCGLNFIEVVADNTKQPNSRWYTGSGIYRNVNLYVGGKEHFIPTETKITTLSLSPARILVESQPSDSACIVTATVKKNGKAVAKGKGSRCEITIPQADLWSAEQPNRYELILILKKDGKTVDKEIIPFGLREIVWNAEEGLKINGNSVKLKGGCIHHDNGLLGACENKKAACRKIRKLKEFGYNAIRYSHYPISKDMLDACDELGMYVVEESFDQWHIPQTKYDYSTHFDEQCYEDLSALIRKDYNRPSVIMYCVGNEISDVGLPGADKTCERLVSFIKKFDKTRPVTLANNALLTALSVKAAEKKQTAGSKEVNDVVAALAEAAKSLTPEYVEAIAGNVFEKIDIVGYNYTEGLYKRTHELQPDRVILSSETFPSKIGRNWKLVESLPYVIGDFMWTAWDYIGEAGVGMPFYGSSRAPFSKPYPCMLASCGSFDITGYPEVQAYYTAIVWGQYVKPYIAVRPLNHSGEEYTVGKWRLTDAIHSWSWNGCEGKEAEIEVYGNGDEIELFKDGISLGRKQFEDCRAFFKTEYSPGTLKAVMYKDGKETETDMLTTAGAETVLNVEAEDTVIKSDGDVTWLNISLTDKSGIVKPLEEKKITVSVTGAAQLKGLGSANPSTEESYLSDSVTTYYGRAQAIIESKKIAGKIKVTVTSEKLSSVTIEIESRK